MADSFQDGHQIEPDLEALHEIIVKMRREGQNMAHIFLMVFYFKQNSQKIKIQDDGFFQDGHQIQILMLITQVVLEYQIPSNEKTETNYANLPYFYS